MRWPKGRKRKKEMATNVFGVAVTTLLQLIRGKIRQGLKVRLADSSSSLRPPALSLSLFKRQPSPPPPPSHASSLTYSCFPCVCLIRRRTQSSLLALIYLPCRPTLSPTVSDRPVYTMCKRKQWRNEITGSLSFLFNLRNRDVLLPSFRVIRCNPPRARASSPLFYFSSSRTQFQQFMQSRLH